MGKSWGHKHCASQISGEFIVGDLVGLTDVYDVSADSLSEHCKQLYCNFGLAGYTA